MRDIAHNFAAVSAIAPAVQSAALNSAAIDTKDFNSLAFVVNTGAIAGSGDFGVKLQESDTTTDADFTDVPADQRYSNAPATLAANSAYRLGYTGWKRYVRAVLSKAGGTSIALGVVAIKGNAAVKPVA